MSTGLILGYNVLHLITLLHKECSMNRMNCSPTWSLGVGGACIASRCATASCHKDEKFLSLTSAKDKPLWRLTLAFTPQLLISTLQPWNGFRFYFVNSDFSSYQTFFSIANSNSSINLFSLLWCPPCSPMALIKRWRSNYFQIEPIWSLCINLWIERKRKIPDM